MLIQVGRMFGGFLPHPLSLSLSALRLTQPGLCCHQVLESTDENDDSGWPIGSCSVSFHISQHSVE
jgi:hypothetical protein